MAIEREALRTESAPAPVGPYSQAMRAGELVFTSGQIPMDPESGDIVSGDIRQEAEQVFRNLDEVLKAAGTSLRRAVKLTVFLTDMAHFGAVNEVYARFFEEPFPARSCVEVAALPKGVRIEAEAVAVV